MSRIASFAAALGFLASLASLAVAAGAAEPARAADKTAASYVHVVIFHLKKDAAGHADDVIAGCRTLEAIPSVRLLKVGRPAPAEESTPKVAAHDYDIALTVLFDDAAGLKTYLVHETHLKFVHQFEGDFESVQVFDFIDQKK